MYVPRAHVMADDAELRALVEEAATGHLITVGPDGYPDSSRLPVILDGDRIIAHMAAKNPQAERIADGSAALVVVAGPGAYVTPSWYASKAEHGKVVPTWNYTEVQARGTVHVHRESEWLLDAVTRLTDRHEYGRSAAWAVTDAPEKFVAGQLHGIIGIEVRIATLDGKAKLSQNRPEADQRGVIDGLAGEPGPANNQVLDTMRAAYARAHDA